VDAHVIPGLEANTPIPPTANYPPTVPLARNLRHPREIMATMMTATAKVGAVTTSTSLEAISDLSEGIAHAGKSESAITAVQTETKNMR
jgi:hypothetical protein